MDDDERKIDLFQQVVTSPRKQVIGAVGNFKTWIVQNLDGDLLLEITIITFDYYILVPR